MRRWVTLACAAMSAVALAAIAATGCGGNADMKPTITLAEAEARVDQLIQEALAQLPQGAQLRKANAVNDVPCSGPDGRYTDQVMAEHSYEILHPTPWPIDQVIEILDRYWRTRGYELVHDYRDDATMPALYVRDPASAIQVGIKLSRPRTTVVAAYLSGSSDCIWPEGTPSHGS